MHRPIIPEGDFEIGPLVQILHRESTHSTQSVKNTVWHFSSKPCSFLWFRMDCYRTQ